MKKCSVCEKTLRGRQRKFCSRACKNADTNNRHQSYEAQQRRGRERKLQLIRLKGEQCENCGYKKNYAALEFHHPDPRQKEFQLDLRTLSNRSWDTVMTEAKKCLLLCSNCHAELHHSECTF